MLNTLSPTWVKNVYSLRLVGGITGVWVYTDGRTIWLNQRIGVYNRPFLPLFIPTFLAVVSTFKTIFSPLLYGHLYPLSTGLIIKRNKEYLRKEQ